MVKHDDEALTPLQLEYLEWLLLPKDEQGCSQNQWCAEHGINPTTVHRWKKNPRFIHEWENRYVEVQIKPDRIAAVLDALYKEATGGDAVAAEKWLKWLDRMAPQKPVDRDAVTEASRLSDEQLIAELRDLADSLDPSTRTET